jgi:hypothetical protein
MARSDARFAGMPWRPANPNWGRFIEPPPKRKRRPGMRPAPSWCVYPGDLVRVVEYDREWLEGNLQRRFRLSSPREVEIPIGCIAYRTARALVRRIGPVGMHLLVRLAPGEVGKTTNWQCDGIWLLCAARDPQIGEIVKAARQIAERLR